MHNGKMLENIVGRPCIGAVAQHETGGDLLLHFASWQSYEDPPDENLLASERGAWSLMVLCPWRLDSFAEVITDWRAVADRGSASRDRYLILEGLSVEEVDLQYPGLDITIRFSRGYVLKTLCDSNGKTSDCWYLLMPDESTLVARRNYRLEVEPPGPTI